MTRETCRLCSSCSVKAEPGWGSGCSISQWHLWQWAHQVQLVWKHVSSRNWLLSWSLRSMPKDITAFSWGLVSRTRFSQHTRKFSFFSFFCWLSSARSPRGHKTTSMDHYFPGKPDLELKNWKWFCVAAWLFCRGSLSPGCAGSTQGELGFWGCLGQMVHIHINGRFCSWNLDCKNVIIIHFSSVLLILFACRHIWRIPCHRAKDNILLRCLWEHPRTESWRLDVSSGNCKSLHLITDGRLTLLESSCWRKSVQQVFAQNLISTWKRKERQQDHFWWKIFNFLPV